MLPNKNREIAPLLVKQHNDDRPYISAKIYDQNITVMLDSGATASVVGSLGIPLLNKLKIKIHKTYSPSVTVADGTKQSILGVADLPILLEDKFQVVKAAVCPTLPQFIIFGVDVCFQFGLKVDYESGNWCVGNKAKRHSSDNPITYDISSLELLSPCQKSQAERVINSFKEICSNTRLGRTNKLSLHIDTGHNKPFKQRQYLMSPYLLKILNKELDDMLRLDVVEPSNSPWCSPVLLVKKSSGEYRFCFDGRKLNESTKHDSYPLPRIDRILNMLKDAKYISSIDLRKAFWQIPLEEESKEKTAFAIPGRGLFQFKVVPFGLCNSAQTQQRLMDSIFGPEFEPNIFVYLDDIIVTSASFQEHLELLSRVKDRLKNANLTVNFEKCDFLKSSLKYLGYVVDGGGLRTDPDKVAAMVSYPRPTNTTEVKRFIGLCSWYRRFINQFSTLVAPINDLLKGKGKKQKICWTPQAENSFLLIKQALVSAPILSSPNFSEKFIIQCDASDCGLGGVLTQVINGEEKVIAFASRSLSKAERNYSVTERECLAVLFSVDKFRPYIEGTRFTVITDHYSLLWLNRLKEPAGRLARWAVKLQQYEFDLIHRKGKFHTVPDALSRIQNNQNVSLIDVDFNNLEPWYIGMRTRVTHYPQEYPQWKAENGVLYKLVPNQLPLKSNISDWKIVVPKTQRKEVINSCHDPPTSGHFGFYKTVARIQETYYWPKLRSDVLKYIRNCKICGSQKSPNTPRPGLMGNEKIVKYPWQIIAIDIMGPFPASPRGFSYLLVVTDWYTKYTLMEPVRAATSKNINEFLEKEVFLMFGVPQIIVCDNGTQFSSSVFREFVASYKVQKIWFNAKYHPQTNFVERYNKTIGTTIRCYIREHKDWDKNIFQIRQAMNTAKHEITGYTPSFLNFGRYVPSSGNYYGQLENRDDLRISFQERESYASDIKQLDQVFKTVRERLHLAYVRNAQKYNQSKRDISFAVGDKVWRKNRVLSQGGNKFMSKLADRYVPGVIINKKSRLVYEIQNEDGSLAGNYHIKDLKVRFESQSDDD